MQTKESGRRALHRGWDVARRLAAIVGVADMQATANIGRWGDRWVLVKTAHRGHAAVSCTLESLAKVTRVIGAFEREPGRYDLYELAWHSGPPPGVARQNGQMRITAARFRRDGRALGRVDLRDVGVRPRPVHAPWRTHSG